ncbi:hypothetical protein JXQ70_16545 [bacterium]|nr:hypothetical protein [bacterium]
MESITNQRSDWLSGLHLEHKEEYLFQLEMNLKGLDRFFNLNNHSFSNFEHLITRDFSEEITIIETAINQIVLITGELLRERTKNIFYFQRFIMDKLLEDFSRDLHLKKVIRQDNPDESLHMLRQAFINFRQIISALKGLGPDVKYLEFNAIGQLITREISRNQFFNPLDNKPFVPEYDRIMTTRLSQIIFGISHPVLRKKISIIYLAMHRLLHYLQYIDPMIDSFAELKGSLLYFTLINSEIKTLLHFIETDYVVFLSDLSETVTINLPKTSHQDSTAETHYLKSDHLRSAIESLIYQLRMELRNVNRRVLKDIILTNAEHRLRGAIENAKGILTNVLQQVIVFFSQEFDADIRGEMIFTVFISRLRQSVILRRDLWVFREIMAHYEEIIETRFDVDTLQCYKDYLSAIYIYVLYFRENTINLLRYDDATEFQKFFDLVQETRVEDLDINYRLESFKLSAKYFKIFLDTMLGNVANRADLQNVPLEMDEVRELLNRFIGGGKH